MLGGGACCPFGWVGRVELLCVSNPACGREAWLGRDENPQTLAVQTHSGVGAGRKVTRGS